MGDLIAAINTSSRMGLEEKRPRASGLKAGRCRSGAPAEIARDLKVFGARGRVEQLVLV